jgi:hypothetical protein
VFLLTLIKSIEKEFEKYNTYKKEAFGDGGSTDKLREILEDRSGKKLENFVLEFGDVIKILITKIRERCTLCIKDNPCPFENCPIHQFSQYRKDGGLDLTEYI